MMRKQLLTVVSIFIFSAFSYPLKNKKFKSFVVNPDPGAKFVKNLPNFGEYRRDLFQGDIVGISTNREYFRTATSMENRKWWHAKIPYVLSPELGFRALRAIRLAIDDFHAHSCVRFVPRQHEEDYMEFIAGNGCYSFVGRVGGKQVLSLGTGCEFKGIAIHEMMHTTGFFHEQSRSDRDSYIVVKWENIESGMESQFQRNDWRDEVTFDEPYDYVSVMHYHNKAFTTNGEDTLIPKAQNVEIGQREGFSSMDLIKLNKLYECPPPELIDPTELEFDALLPVPHPKITPSPTDVEVGKSIIAKLATIIQHGLRAQSAKLKSIFFGSSKPHHTSISDLANKTVH